MGREAGARWREKRRSRARGGPRDAAEADAGDPRNDLGRSGGRGWEGSPGARRSPAGGAGGRGDAPAERCGWETPVRGGLGWVQGWPGGRGRRARAGHAGGCARSGRFDDRSPFPSFPAPLRLPWRCRGAEPFPVSRSWGFGDPQESLGRFARSPL